MTNAQAALLAAASSLYDGAPVERVTQRAEALLRWLRQFDTPSTGPR